MRPTFAAQLNKMITAGLGGNVSAPETGVAVGRLPKYTSIGPAALLEFEANVALPFRALSVDMVPVQDLHGQDAPYPGGGSKNLIPLTLDGIKAKNTGGTWSGNSYANYGVTFTILTDNDGNVIGINANGTASQNASLSLPLPSIADGTSVVLNGCPQQASIITRIWVGESGYSDIVADSGHDVTFTYSEDVARIWCQVLTGKTANNMVFKPMIRLASVSDATFAPYSNICPISGYDEVNIWRDAEHDTTSEPEVTIQFDETVYSGRLDVVSGVLTVDRAMVDLGTLTWSYASSPSDRFYATLAGVENVSASAVANAVCEQYAVGSWNAVAPDNTKDNMFALTSTYVTVRDMRYTDAALFKAAVNGVQLAYPLATPVAIQLTAEQLSTLIGTNYVWSDGGNVSLTYTNVYFTEGY